MKTNLSILFAALAATLTASALPLTTENNVNKRGNTELPPTFSVQGRQDASVLYDSIECVVTPVWLKDGTVEISAVLREYIGGHAEEISKPHFTAKLGQCGVIEYGDLAFQVTTSLAK